MRCRVVVAGAGFGGLNAARILSRHNSIDLTIIDENGSHVFQPLIYQVATWMLNAEDVVYPIRNLFRFDLNVHVVLGRVIEISREFHFVRTTSGQFEYDYLILSCGSLAMLPKNEAWQKHCITLKSLDDAIEIRNRLASSLEAAESSFEESLQIAWGTFVIIGGGSTGVELAGAISDYLYKKVNHNFRRTGPMNVRIVLLEAGDRILAQLPARLSAYAMKCLARMGIEVITQARVTSIERDGVYIRDKFIPSKTVIWTAGVRSSGLNEGLAKEFGLPMDSKGRIVVDSDLSLFNAKNIFLIGDQACVFDKRGGDLPALAPVAIQEGKHAARQILNDLSGHPRHSFKYWEKGQMVVLGRGKAVGQIQSARVYGRLAWMIWAMVHLYYLTGLKNRLFVLFAWVYSGLSGFPGANANINRDSAESRV